jgi:hypothetical protein
MYWQIIFFTPFNTFIYIRFFYEIDFTKLERIPWMVIRNMKSIKKLVMASAVALGLGVFSALPASAADMSLSVKVGAAVASSNATTALVPAAVTVPADNTIDEADTVRLVATVDTGTSVSFVATGAIKLVAALDNPAAVRVRSTDGASSVAIATGTGNTVTVYAYTTSVAAGTITVSNGGVTNTIYMKGTAGAASAVSVVAPLAVASNTVATYVFTAVDVFGNKVSGLAINATVAGATVASTGLNAATVTTAVDTATVGLGNAELKVLAPANGSITVVVTASGVVAIAATTVVSDLAAELAKVKAELVAEKAGRAVDKAASDSATATTKAASDAAMATVVASNATAKVATDKAIADLTAAVAKLEKTMASIKAKYNAMAKKHKFALIK